MAKTILLADDSVTIQKVVELTFMEEDYAVVAVSDGAAALERLPEVAPDLVIADVHMPGADGYQVCRHVKQRFPHTPVLLLVGTFETYDEAEAEAAGADDHLKKPFDSQDLLSRVRDLLSAGANLADWQPAAVAPTLENESGEGAEAQPAGAGHEPVGFVSGALPMAPVLSTPAPEAPVELTDEMVDRVARRVVELLSEEAVREVAWEVIPDLAEVVIKERLNELEREAE